MRGNLIPNSHVHLPCYFRHSSTFKTEIPGSLYPVLYHHSTTRKNYQHKLGMVKKCIRNISNSASENMRVVAKTRTESRAALHLLNEAPNVTTQRLGRDSKMVSDA